MLIRRRGENGRGRERALALFLVVRVVSGWRHELVTLLRRIFTAQPPGERVVTGLSEFGADSATAKVSSRVRLIRQQALIGDKPSGGFTRDLTGGNKTLDRLVQRQHSVGTSRLNIGFNAF